jgi:hypothetical protein
MLPKMTRRRVVSTAVVLGSGSGFGDGGFGRPGG